MSDAQEDQPTQRLPGRGEASISSEDAAKLAADLMQPTVSGDAPGSTPPTLSLDAAEAPPPRPRERVTPRPVLGDWQGQLAGRYELLEELGRGGMGVPSTRPSASLGASLP